MLMSTTTPSLWAFSSSGVPNLLLACRKPQKRVDLRFLMHGFWFFVHNVDQHEPVGFVYKTLQLIWSAEPAAGLQETTKGQVESFLTHSDA